MIAHRDKKESMISKKGVSAKKDIKVVKNNKANIGMGRAKSFQADPLQGIRGPIEEDKVDKDQPSMSQRARAQEQELKEINNEYLKVPEDLFGSTRQKPSTQ